MQPNPVPHRSEKRPTERIPTHGPVPFVARERRRLMFVATLLASLMPPLAATAAADHVLWFNPAGAKVSNGGALVPAATPQAIRIQHPGGPALIQGTVTITLGGLRSDVMVDSLYVCYRTVFQDPDPSRIIGIVLRTMGLPMATTTLLSST